MTEVLTQEIDKRLRAFINAPDNFLDSIGLVNAFHNYPVLASDVPYALEISGQKVVPVFTDANDLEVFKQTQASAKDQAWVLRSSLDILEEVIVGGLSGMVYNLKKTGDMGNSTLFKSADLIQFVNYYTTILNNIMGDANQKADTFERKYLVPAFVTPTGETTSNRRFPTITNPDGDSYVPAFTDLQAFAKWYNHADFGGQFRQLKGTVLTWTLSAIKKPVSETGENHLKGAKGVAINPFNEQMTVLEWAVIEE